MSVFPVLRGRATHRAHARALLERWGRTPFSRIAMGPGYRYAICAGGECVIPWKERGACAIALGEPVGPVHLREEAAAEFRRRSLSLGLHPVFVPVETGLFRAAGFRLFRIGRTARWDVAGFDLRGSASRSVRQSVRRGEREGLYFELWAAPRMERLRELRSVSTAWLAGKRLPERDFGTGRFDVDDLSSRRVAVVRSRFGRAEAFVSLVEGYSATECAVDLMRRRPDAPAGTMELLLVRAAAALKKEGQRFLNLGLAPLAGMGATWTERALALVYRHGTRVYNFEGLDRFKSKFRPRWETEYIACPSRVALPRALFALAELGGRNMFGSGVAGARRAHDVPRIG